MTTRRTERRERERQMRLGEADARRRSEYIMYGIIALVGPIVGLLYAGLAGLGAGSVVGLLFAGYFFRVARRTRREPPPVASENGGGLGDRVKQGRSEL